ncbi:uncharacterized protein N7473_002820 [Penicillium subrubescens]|uniref:uncharacterized protein n=1 Tax=Penicillium subrubescens TaxID=1316194 RepID=UPI002544F082|nr:uncharacterized protein N7473_002820 [Penicillium subrubescens]KAJ5905904.1 hypothetical protein N7473_002820 [Penicillium subrubescens]
MEKNQQADFGASLIVVPAKVILNGLRAHLGSPAKARTIRSTGELLQKLQGLDEKDAKTAYTLVITTYDTMRRRTIKAVGPDGEDMDPKKAPNPKTSNASDWKTSRKSNHATSTSKEGLALGVPQIVLAQMEGND